MIEGTSIIYKREDLFESRAAEPLESVSCDMVRGSFEPIIRHTVVLFVDNDGRTKVLKNRYGDQGVVAHENG